MTRASGSRAPGHLLARHSFYNLAGFAVPVVLGLAAMPFLVRGLGLPRFGVLALVWAAVGYFNVFGLGLDRALAFAVASRPSVGGGRRVAAVVWTALAASLALGAAAGAAVLALAPLLVGVLRLPPELASEALLAFRLLAPALPFVVGAAALAGVLQGRRRFGLLNLAAVPASAWSYLGPLAVLPFSRSLVPVVAVLLAGRVLLFAAYLAMCLRVVPGLRRGVVVRPRLLAPLVRYGGWLSVSNVASPLMAYLDRFFVGALVSVTAVAYYATPHEVVTRLAALPGAVAAALFPAVAAAADDPAAATLLERAARLVLVLVFPPALVLAAFGPELLGVWLGSDFAERSAPVLRLLAAGLVVNGLAMVAASALQARGRPDLTAKLHLAELPLFLGLLFLLASRYGMAGAAAAWTARVAMDGAALWWLARTRVPGAARALRRTAPVAAAALVLLAAASLPAALAPRLAVAGAGAVLAAAMARGALTFREVAAERPRGAAGGSG